MNDKLIIIGASGHGKVVADIALRMNKWRSIEFLDDNESIQELMGFKIIGKVADAVNYLSSADFFVAIGNNQIRELIQNQLINKGLSIATLIHPDTSINTDVKLGIGSAVMAGVVINSSSCIGEGCIINTNSNIDHDNVIKNFVHVSPGVNLAGNVTLGEKCWIGIGSSVVNNIKICNESQIGAGAVVLKDINEPGTYVGVPVRRITQ